MKCFVLTASIFLTAVCGSARAAPIIEDFTFADSNNQNAVTGELDFAASGTNVAATGAYVLTAPSNIILPGARFNYAAASTISNSFTVTADGTITAADFFAYDSGFDILVLNHSGADQVIDSSGNAVDNLGGLSGLSFSVPGSTTADPLTVVSEPATLSLLAVGMVGIAARRMFQRKAASS